MRDLLRLAVLALDFAADQQIEFLFGGAEFDVGIYFDGVVGDEQRIKQLVHRDRLIGAEARAEILALEHARQAIFRAELNHFDAGELAEPVGVVHDFGFFAIENAKSLIEISFRVGVHLLARQRRARFGLAGRIADHGGKSADQKNRGVAEILKMLQLAHHHRMAEMKIGSGGIDAQFHAQRLAGFQRLLELGAEFRFRNNFSDAFAQVGELFFDGLEIRHRYFFSGVIRTRRPSMRKRPSRMMRTASV